MGKQIQRILFPHAKGLSPPLYWLLIFGTTGIYGLVFAVLYPGSGKSAASLSVFPVALTAWLFGMRFGICFAVLMIPINALLLNLVGQTGWDTVFRNGGGLGILALFIVAMAVGRMRDMGQALGEALARRRQIEADLRESEERSRQLADATFEAIVIHDQGIILEVNQSFCRMYGYDYPEVIGKSALDLTAPESRDLLREKIATGDPLPYEGLALRKNGTVFPAEVTSRPMTYRGRMVQATAIRDLTARKQDEQILRASEATEREQRLLAEALRDTAAAINSSLEINEVLEQILVCLDRVVPHDAADVMLINQGVARVVRARGYTGRNLEVDPMAVTLPLDTTPHVRRVVETGQVQIVADVQLDPDWIVTPVSGWIRSYLAAPITVDEQVMGVLNLNSAIVGKFSSRDAELLRAFTDQAATAIRNAQLYDAIQQHVTELETLRRLVLDLTAKLDLKAVMHTLTEGMLSLVGAKNGGLFWYLPKEDVLEVVVAVGAPSIPIGTRIHRGEGFTGRVLDNRTALLIDDYNSWEGHASAGVQFHYGAMIGVPIIWRGELLGVFRATSNDSKRTFSMHDAQLLDLLAGQAAIAIRNAQLFTAEYEQRSLAEALRDTAEALVSTLDPAVVMARILENVGRVVPHDWADISLIEGDSARIVYCRGWSPEDEAWLKTVRLPLDWANIRQMLSDTAPLLIADTYAYPGWVKTFPKIHSFLGTAIRARGKVIGFLKLSSAEPGFFTSQHAERLRVFADQTAVAIENAQLYDTLRHYTAELEHRIVERTAELYRVKEHTEAILNNSSDAILVVRRNGSISQINSAFSRLLGYQPEEIVGQSWRMFVKPEQARILEQVFGSIFGADHPIRTEVDVCRKDGMTFSADVGVSVISKRSEDADSAAWEELVCSLHDISASKRAEKELRLAFDREKELSELKDRFISTVSHEFRTPLTVIRTSSDLLAMYPTHLSTERKLKLLQDIQVYVDYMVHLLDDALTIGKGQSGKIQFNPAAMDVKVFSKAVLEQLELADADKHRFTFIANGNLTNISLDEQLLRQILVNLLSNAIKYSPKGSEIYFEILREPDDVLFLVKDHGLGIPAADQAHLFEAFHRAKNVARIQGTGLGLTIVKANVEAHGGSITFDSQENRGTTFAVRLPARVDITPLIPLSTS